MRPRGDVSLALAAAAAQQPGTVAQLAERACVGYATARYTASRLVKAGELVPLDAGRPAVLGAPPMAPCGEDLGDSLVMLHLSFWGSGSATDGLD